MPVRGSTTSVVLCVMCERACMCSEQVQGERSYGDLSARLFSKPKTGRAAAPHDDEETHDDNLPMSTRPQSSSRSPHARSRHSTSFVSCEIDTSFG